MGSTSLRRFARSPVSAGRRVRVGLCVLVLGASLSAAVAIASAPVIETEAGDGPALYVVQLSEPPVAVYEGGIRNLAATAPRVTGTRKLDVDSPATRAYDGHLQQRQSELLTSIAAVLGRAVTPRFQYRHAYNGFALELSPSEALAVAELDGIELLFREIEQELQTDTGPAFIGAPAIWSGNAMGSAGHHGEGVIVGVLDTGVNHDHPSFAATDAQGYTHVNPFGAGNYVGYCVSVPSFCNDKLIGAWALHPSVSTPEDDNGHGSHTASTAAGNFVDNPVFVAPTASFPFARASGVAPRANLIAYRVCAPGCPTATTTAAVNQAVIDGVDVINYSISGGANPWVETTAVAFRNAVAAGIVVVTSAGNSGPGPSTVGHQAPWVLATAASTHDRAVLASVVDLTSSGGSLPDLHGEAAAAGFGPAPIVFGGSAPYNNPLCDPFPAGTFTGQIVVCDRGVIGRVQKGANVLAAGGSAMILVNDAPSAASLNADGHVLPAVHLGYVDGLLLKGWLASGSGHSGSLTGGVVDYGSYGDVMASFSSRGPAGSSVPALIDTIKPDLTAPGLNILAAYHTAGSPPPPEYMITSGTSMSSPHVAGAAALLRGVRPDWTPVEIKSALMLSAQPVLVKEDALTPADAFDQGAGGADLDGAVRAALVLDISTAEFVAANPSLGGVPRNLNLPSLADSACASTCTWTRTLRSTLVFGQQWEATVVGPTGAVSGSVVPANFNVAAGAGQALQINFDPAGLSAGGWHFGQLVLTPVGGALGPSEPGVLRMPIAIRRTDVIFANDFELL